MSSEPPSDPRKEPPPGIGSEPPLGAKNEPPPSTITQPAGAVSSPSPPSLSSPPLPPRIRRSSTSLRFRLAVEGVLGVLLIGFLVFNSIDQRDEANRLLARQVAAQKGDLAVQQSQIDALQAEIKDLKERWYGAPALFSPPAIANTDIKFFAVTGTSQAELISSLNQSSICSIYPPCAPDPAVPNGVAWALEGSTPGGTYYCYSPSTTTVVYREFVVLPQWSPPLDGTVKIPLVEAWNALEQVLYTHEAGHVAISQQDIAALNDQAQQLPTCGAVFSFWSSASLFTKLDADQAAYHARLHADCRPEIGCLPPGWMGW